MDMFVSKDQLGDEVLVIVGRRIRLPDGTLGHRADMVVTFHSYRPRAEILFGSMMHPKQEAIAFLGSLTKFREIARRGADAVFEDERFRILGADC